MTRKTVGFSVLIFLVILSFSIATFCAANNGNFDAKSNENEKNKIFTSESDSNHPVWPQKSVGPQREEDDETDFKFDISEKSISNMIDKLFTVNGVRNIISNGVPGVPFLWDWLSLYFSSSLGDELVVDFKTTGICIFNNDEWIKIFNNGVDPVSIVSFNNKLAVDFGPDYGILIYNKGNWKRLYKGVEVKQMVGLINNLVVDFGNSFGIFEYNCLTDQWTRIFGSNKIPRDSMVSLGDKLVVDFKTAGICIYYDGVWKSIYKGGVDPVNMVSFNGKLAVDFGLEYGILVYDYETYTWRRIYRGGAVEKMTAFGKYLAVDFGTASGLYIYDFDSNAWTLLYKGLAIENMTGFNNKLAIDFGLNYGIYEYNLTTDTWKKIFHASVLRDDMCASDVFD
ncbi:MAG: hypothetical protein ACMUIU_07815 [bacterium]